MYEDENDNPSTEEGAPFEDGELESESDDAAVFVCTVCDGPIEDEYHHINDVAVCGHCRQEAEARTGSRSSRFVWAMVWGGIAAGLGSAIYMAAALLTGYEYPVMALLVGLIVGGAVRHGSCGRGGWFYRVLAMFLTYTAVVTAYVPFIISSLDEDFNESTLATPADSPDETESAAAAESGSAVPEVASSEEATAGLEESPDFESLSAGQKVAGVLIVLLIVLVLAYLAPFLMLSGGDGIIGLIIIAVGLYAAAALNKSPRLRIEGPYSLHGQMS